MNGKKHWRLKVVKWKKIKFSFAGFGSWVLKLLMLLMVYSIFTAQIEFDVRILKRKEGFIQTVTNVFDTAYAGYKSLIP